MKWLIFIEYMFYIQENVENSRNNPPLVSALTKVVCEFCSQKLEGTEVLFFILFSYFKR